MDETLQSQLQLLTASLARVDKLEASARSPAEVGLQARRLLPQGFSVGDRVVWTRTDAGLPEGTVGTVQHPTATTADDRIEVAFPKGTWSFRATELRRARPLHHWATPEQEVRRPNPRCLRPLLPTCGAPESEGEAQA